MAWPSLTIVTTSGCRQRAIPASLVCSYDQKMLDWRLSFAERTLTAYRATPDGLVLRRG